MIVLDETESPSYKLPGGIHQADDAVESTIVGSNRKPRTILVKTWEQDCPNGCKALSMSTV